MKTKHLQITRGQTYSFTETVYDDVTHLPKDLTGAKIHFAMRADMKVDPVVKLTNENPLPSTWRAGVTLAAQTGSLRGQFTVTLIPADTAPLVALGHDDPYFYEVWIEETDGTTYPFISTSQLDLYPQAGLVP